MHRSVRLIALAAIFTLSLATPSAQAAPTRYESENATITQGVVESNHAGYSGTGFVNYDNVAGSAVETTVNAPAAGTAAITLRYANGTALNRPMDISVNGTTVSAGLAFPATGGWATWTSKSVTAQVNAGPNTVRATATTANGGPNLDHVDLDVAAPAAEYQAENAAISQGIVDTKHAGYTGSGFVDYANVTGSSVEFTVDAASAGSTALTFRYANGTTTGRPMDIAVNGVTIASAVVFDGTGAWTTWVEKPVNATLNAGANTVRATATTANGGPNLDRLTLATAGPPDTEKPTVPTGPRATGTTASSISLAWTASTDNSGTIKDYRVREGSTVVATVTGTTATISGLAASTSHTYTVTARDPSNNESAASAPVTASTQAGGGGTPATINGQLTVCGVKLCNQYGRPIQLRGMSSHGLQWYSQCLNTASLDALADDWKSDVLRISMYIQEGGYETDPRGFTDRVHNLIEQATARGMYAIVDWHMLTPGDPNVNLARAKTFFTEIATRHNGKTNLLYEIANEPNGVSWGSIKSYAEQLIPVIRAKDPETPILVGTRAWSSLGVSDGASESEIVNNPVNASNIMYTFHFYAASHDAAYLNTLSRAADRLPLFVTEFGTQTASGDGGNNFTRSQQYLDLLAAKKISWVNWNYSDDSRSGAVFTPGTCPSGPYAGTSRLKPAGVWIRERMRTPDDFPTG